MARVLSLPDDNRCVIFIMLLLTVHFSLVRVSTHGYKTVVLLAHLMLEAASHMAVS